MRAYMVIFSLLIGGSVAANTAWSPASPAQPPCKDEGNCLICYECVSTDEAECGEPFNPWLFQPVICTGKPAIEVKCAIQKQRPGQGKALFGAIARGCYEVNQVPGLNDSDGCRQWTNPKGYNAQYCFCSEDICNSAAKHTLTIFGTGTIFSTVLVTPILLLLRNVLFRL